MTYNDVIHIQAQDSMSKSKSNSVIPRKGHTDVLQDILYFNNLSKNALIAQKNKEKHMQLVQQGYPRVFELESDINEDIKHKISAMNTQDFINSLSIKDILERKPCYQQMQMDSNQTTLNDGERTKNERQRLINFVSEKLKTVLKTECDGASLFQKLVESLVDSRLRLKMFDPESTMLEEGEKMDSVLITLEGHVDVRDCRTGRVMYTY